MMPSLFFSNRVLIKEEMRCDCFASRFHFFPFLLHREFIISRASALKKITFTQSMFINFFVEIILIYYFFNSFHPNFGRGE